MDENGREKSDKIQTRYLDIFSRVIAYFFVHKHPQSSYKRLRTVIRELANSAPRGRGFIELISAAWWQQVRWTRLPRSVTFPLSDLAIPVNPDASSLFPLFLPFACPVVIVRKVNLGPSCSAAIIVIFDFVAIVIAIAIVIVIVVVFL